MLISDTQRERNWTVLQEMDWVRSYIGVAVRAKGKLLGVLSVDSPIPGFFNREHIQRVQAFADHAAVAIENARLFQEVQRRADQMTTLYEIGLTLTQGLEMEQVLASLHTQCQQVLPCDAFYVAMYDEKSGMIQHPLFYGDGKYYQVEPRCLKEQPGLSGYVIQSRKPVYIPDVLSPDVADTYSVIWITDEEHRTRSYVGVPLVARDQVIGVISMQHDQPGIYTPEQIRLLETIASQAAMTIENARIFNEMKQMAITDSRTGTFTRWHFSTLGQIEIERAQRYGHDMALLMMDIDRFKYFNDTYGHNIGDQLIEAVAKVCQKGLRSSDIIGRYGGDEFAIILPETNLEGALRTAERIRSLVETIEVKSEERSTRVTISLGLVMREQGQLSLDELLICADRALYAAKQAGRNRVEVYLGCGSSIAPAVTLVSNSGK